MSKYKILWIDDKWDELISIKELFELPVNGMEIIPCKYSVDGMDLFEKYLEQWSGVILDAKVLMDKDAKLDQLNGLRYSIEKIHELAHIREVPYYIFTGQPDLISNGMFAEAFGRFYEKDCDEEELIIDIKKNADELINTQIVHKYQVVFDTWPEIHHDLLRILKVLEAEDWTNNSLFTDVRKVLSNVFNRCYERGVCTIKHDGSNLAECSSMMGQRYMEEIVPVYVQRALHSCTEITNPGSHRTIVDTHVANGSAPYLVRSLIYELLNILYWCKRLPDKSDRELALLALQEAERIYEEKKRERSKKKRENSF